MIGHYLLMLSPEQEDRVLTLPMSPPRGKRRLECLVEVASGSAGGGLSAPHDYEKTDHALVGTVYDALIKRFGEARINAAIRNRILSNRARRALTAPAAGVDSISAFNAASTSNTEVPHVSTV